LGRKKERILSVMTHRNPGTGRSRISLRPNQATEAAPSALTHPRGPSEFVRLEVLPKVLFNRKSDEAERPSPVSRD